MRCVLRPATESDFPAIVAIINAQVNEPTTMEQFLRMEKLRPKEDPVLRLVAVTESGEVAGYGITSGGSMMRAHTFMVRIRVASSYRRQGIGLDLLTALERWAREQGARRLESTVQEKDEADVAWTERHGYAKEHHLFESTLALPDFNPNQFNDAVQIARDKGIRFTSLADEGEGDELLRRYFDFSLPIMMSQPGVDGMPAPPYERWHQFVTTSPTWDPHGVILAADGDQWVALSQVDRLPSGGYYNGFTGVHQEYRGRGLALPLKVVALTYAKEKGAPYIRTNNHSSNQPMLAVNRKLGYQPEPGIFALVKSLV